MNGIHLSSGNNYRSQSPVQFYHCGAAGLLSLTGEVSSHPILKNNDAVATLAILFARPPSCQSRPRYRASAGYAIGDDKKGVLHFFNLS
jgi:hypothetical protein